MKTRGSSYKMESFCESLRISTNHGNHTNKIFFLYIGNHLESHANLCESLLILVIFEKFAFMSYPSDENMKFLMKKNNCQFRSCQFKARVKFSQKSAVRILPDVPRFFCRKLSQCINFSIH
jgi:hypothetical protein